MNCFIKAAALLVLVTPAAHADILYYAKNQRGGVTVLTDEKCPVSKHLQLAYATGADDTKLTKACWLMEQDKVSFLTLPDQEVRQMDKKLFQRITLI
jgi:hypothetical protein